MSCPIMELLFKSAMYIIIIFYFLCIACRPQSPKNNLPHVLLFLSPPLVGVNMFYICIIVYLYGDLAIYAAAVPISLMEVAW